MPGPKVDPRLWLTWYPLNETQPMLTLEQIQWLSPDPVEEGPEVVRIKSPGNNTRDPGQVPNPLARMVYVHFFAAGFSFWVYEADTDEGVFQGYARFLGSAHEGQFCQLTHWDLTHLRFPDRIVNGKILDTPISRDTTFTPRTLLEALGYPAPGQDPG